MIQSTRLDIGTCAGSHFSSSVVGLRKIGSPVLVEEDDPFHMGSLTKAMTSTLLAMLIKNGTLTWDTKLAEVFRELLRKIHRWLSQHDLAHACVAPFWYFDQLSSLSQSLE
jgi:hypothetical protein